MFKYIDYIPNRTLLTRKVSMAEDVSASDPRHDHPTSASASSSSANSNGSVAATVVDVVFMRLVDKVQTKTNITRTNVDDGPMSTSVADLLVSLFMAALTSYRRDTVLRPFPQAYQQIMKDFRQLKSVADEIPSLASLMRHHRASTIASATLPSDFSKSLPRPEVLSLLDWILDNRNLTLERVASPSTAFSDIKRRTGQVMDMPCPTHVFEVHYNHAGYGRTLDAKFESDDKELIYAFHGSRLENFHSILHNGLRNHMNKNSVFGEGTYLSSELSVCMTYSPIGQGWRKSIFGDKLSCVAVCQLIRHPDVKCHTRDAKNGSSSNILVRPGHCSAQNIPEKYYLVRNDELVRVKYLLVYTDRPAIQTERNSPVRRSWFFRNRFLLTMLAYVVVLLAIGLSSSSWFRSSSYSQRFKL